MNLVDKCILKILLMLYIERFSLQKNGEDINDEKSEKIYRFWKTFIHEKIGAVRQHDDFSYLIKEKNLHSLV